MPAPTGDRTGSYFDVAYASRVGEHQGGGLSVPAPVLHAFTDISAHPTMALVHLLAAVACGWWLAQGERALWLLIHLASRRWTELVAPALRRWVARCACGHGRAAVRRAPGAGGRRGDPTPAVPGLQPECVPARPPSRRVAPPTTSRTARRCPPDSGAAGVPLYSFGALP